MKHILLTGGTGFIGKELRRLLLQEGHYLTIVTRRPNKYEDERQKISNLLPGMVIWFPP